MSVDRAIVDGVPVHEAPVAIERLLGIYLAERHAGENVLQFCARHTGDEIRSFLAGDARVEA
jgi:sulfite reductase beta subunit-like hemoprotein